VGHPPARHRRSRRLISCLAQRVSNPRCRPVVRRYAYDRDSRLRTGGHHRPGPRRALTALTAAGVGADRVFTDKLSGSAKTARPGLVAMLDYARAGDTVVVTAIDRLGRSVAEVTRTIADLVDRRIVLRALRAGIDTAMAPVVQWLRSWLPSPNSNSSWAGSAAPRHEGPAAPASCRRPSRKN
jgi:Resolvase, N terminal domain